MTGRFHPGTTGVGLGLRWEFLDEVLEAVRGERPMPKIDFLEVSPENYMRRGGYVPGALDEVASSFPLVSHGLTMSAGGLDPLGDGFMRELEAFLDRHGATFYSDHLCVGGHEGRLVHDLLPLPLIEESVVHTSERLLEIRDRLKRPFAIENISYYAHAIPPEIPETEFISRILERGDALLLLDLNNVCVNASNFGFEAKSFVDALPLERVVSIHVAGGAWSEEHRLVIDTHGTRVSEAVKELLVATIAKVGPVPVVLERDHHIPPFDVLLSELDEIREAYDRGLARHAENPR